MIFDWLKPYPMTTDQFFLAIIVICIIASFPLWAWNTSSCRKSSDKET